MFFSTCRFIVCSLIYPFWLFAAQGVETSASNLEDKYCTAKQDSRLDCGEQSMSDQSLEDQLYKNQILGYFSDIVFENSFCKCQGNNGCTRGCVLASLLDKDQYPPIRKCEGKKPTDSSSFFCARHITGAIMTIIHNFLADHCKKTNGGILEDTTDYQQCVNNFREDLKINNTNICRHSFIFPSALCMLNLDGQSAHNYNSIPNEDVRLKCKRWNRYNQSLLAVNASLYNGEIRIIPLFKKISPEKNKEFQMDPRKIPNGAIIITKSHLKYGHVEVKTDRNECGKNKTQTCFCSDFCQERLRYNQPVLAVFEWNSEFIRYMSMDNY